MTTIDLVDDDEIYTEQQDTALERLHEATRALLHAKGRFGDDHPETAYQRLVYNAADAACVSLCI
jgi:hypothetical protein